jgi:hypothetical protein
MGPVVLVTLGVLFLLTEFWHMRFQWPVLLIVIGLVKIWQSTTSTEGHMQYLSGTTHPPASGQNPPDNNQGQVPNV